MIAFVAPETANIISWDVLRLMMPELILAIAITLAIILDFMLPEASRQKGIRVTAFVGAILSLGMVLAYMLPIESVLTAFGFEQAMDMNGNLSILPIAESVLGGMLIVWPLANLCKLILLVGITLIILTARERAEFYYLLLAATLGGMFLASTSDLITLFVGLELLSITSYVMVGLRKQTSIATEAGMKYLIMGGISSALILYGMSFLYGTTGTTDIALMADKWAAAGGAFDGMVQLAFFLILAGVGFKIATAPFHVWAPDVYQGANSPTTAFLAVTSKSAGFFLLIPLLYQVFYRQGAENMSDYQLTLQVLAGLAMLIGNVMAVRQNDVKRLLAYSGVANSGYLLLPMSLDPTATHVTEFFYYLIAYMIMNIGLFAILLHLQWNEQVQGGDANESRAPLSTFAGLYHRAPGTALAAVVLILSLAGLPLTGGFMGKWFILFGAIQEQAYWLAALLLATTVIAFYYYFGLIRQMFMRSGTDGEKIGIRWSMQTGMWACVVATIALGIFPTAVYNWILDIIVS